MNDTIEITGKYTDATIHADRSMVDDTCLTQVQGLTQHEAFRNKIELMPDAHAGAGAVIGFTMPLGDHICPNTVGVDVGCGMTAYNLGVDPVIEIADIDDSNELLRDADERIREAVPTGRKTFADTPTEQDYHIVDDFPWDVCADKCTSLYRNYDGVDRDAEVPDYGKEYFLDLCERVGYDVNRAINSIGTLGGGNHFIELSKSDATGEYWVVVHSGSRGIGYAIADYWQERAHENCDDRAPVVHQYLSGVPDWSYKFDLDDVSDVELLDWLQGGMGEDWKNTDEIADCLDGEEIGELIDQLNDTARYVSENSGGDELDYLDTDDLRAGYLADMVFAQTYARESRAQMCQAVADVFNAEVQEVIVSTHNYIDTDDLVIRKGATRVWEDERAIIPFNMADGAVIVRGRGNDDWHCSAPHGAGRRGSRTWAESEFSVGEFAESMDGVFSTSVSEATLDEAPMAYKDHNKILEYLDETAEVEETLTPICNIKADQ